MSTQAENFLMKSIKLVIFLYNVKTDLYQCKITKLIINYIETAL